MKNVCNSSFGNFTFTLEPLLDDVRYGIVSCNITAINECNNAMFYDDSVNETYDGNDICVHYIAYA